MLNLKKSSIAAMTALTLAAATTVALAQDITQADVDEAIALIKSREGARRTKKIADADPVLAQIASSSNEEEREAGSAQLGVKVLESFRDDAKAEKETVIPALYASHEETRQLAVKADNVRFQVQGETKSQSRREVRARAEWKGLSDRLKDFRIKLKELKETHAKHKKYVAQVKAEELKKDWVDTLSRSLKDRPDAEDFCEDYLVPFLVRFSNRMKGTPDHQSIYSTWKETRDQCDHWGENEIAGAILSETTVSLISMRVDGIKRTYGQQSLTNLESEISQSDEIEKEASEKEAQLKKAAQDAVTQTEVLDVATYCEQRVAPLAEALIGIADQVRNLSYEGALNEARKLDSVSAGLTSLCQDKGVAMSRQVHDQRMSGAMEAITSAGDYAAALERGMEITVEKMQMYLDAAHAALAKSLRRYEQISKRVTAEQAAVSEGAARAAAGDAAAAQADAEEGER